MKRINLDDFTAPEDFGTQHSLAIKVRPPESNEPFRVHADLPRKLVMVVRSGYYYLVAKQVHQVLGEHVFRAYLVLATNKDGEHFLWPVRMDDESAIIAADLAKNEWTDCEWSTHKRAYISKPSVDQKGDAKWPDADIETLASAAFGRRIIDTVNHKVVKKLVPEYEAQQAAVA